MWQEFRYKLSSLIGTASVIIGVVYLIALIVNGAVQTHVTHWHFTVHQYLASAGYDTVKNYPVQLGAPTATQLEGNTDPHFFLLTGKDAVAQGLQPSSKVRLGLQISNRGYVLELPFSEVTFVQHETGADIAGLTVANPAVDSAAKKWHFTLGEALLLRSRTYDPLQPGIRDTYTWKLLNANGIGSFLQDYVTHVYLNLTRQDYAEYLGGS